jgi:chemotaxis protein MotB
MRMRTLGIFVSLLPLWACVPQGKYDAALRDAAQAHAEAAQCTTTGDAARIEISRLRDALSRAEQLAAKRDQELSVAQTSAHELQTKLDNATAENDQLRKELTRLGKNADALLAEKGTLASALADTKARLEELRKAQAAADARAALFKQLALKFQKMIDAGQLKVTLRNGRMVLQLSNDVLFDSGQTELKPSGAKALAQVATVLKTLDNRRFQVAGDTDNVPIDTARFPSNWELSTRRAVEVVHFLVSQGLRSDVLSAAGYGEFDPIASNEAPSGRAKNRRIEITLQPNIDELVAVPEAK